MYLNKIVVWKNQSSGSKYSICYKNRITYVIRLSEGPSYIFRITDMAMVRAIVTRTHDLSQIERLFDSYGIYWKRIEDQLIWHDSEAELQNWLCYSLTHGFIDLTSLHRQMVHIFWDGEKIQYQHITGDCYELEINLQPLQICKSGDTWTKIYEILSINTLSGKQLTKSYRYLVINYHDKDIVPTCYLLHYAPAVKNVVG